MILMRRTFFQINFQDLAAEFAKKKHESFTTLTSHHAQCRLTMLRFLGCCRGMYIVSHGQRSKATRLLYIGGLCTLLCVINIKQLLGLVDAHIAGGGQYMQWHTLSP